MKDKPDKKEHIQLHLEFLFQASETVVEAPAELQEEVFGTLEALEIMAEIVDLFTVKFLRSNLSMLDDLEQNKQ